MYLLDPKIPKRLKKAQEYLYSSYISHLDKPLTENKVNLLLGAIGCFCNNASYRLSGGSTTFDITLSNIDYSKPLVYNCNRVKRRVSFTYTKLFVNWMVDEGLIELSVGSVGAWDSSSGRVVPSMVQKSLVSLSQELIDILKPVCSKEDQEILSVLEMRDFDGGVLVKRLKQQQVDLISLLNSYNMYSKDSSITIDGVDYLVHLKKVFNRNSWDMGGRSYVCGTGTTELMKKSNRSRILINGEETVEGDWKACHMSIIGDIEGYTFPTGFDPYGISLPGYDVGCLRSIAKVGILCMVNCKSVRQAAQALSWEITNNLPLKVWKTSGLVPDPVRAKDVLGAVVEHNQYATGWLCEDRGLTLQNIESKMMDWLLDYFIQDKGLTIPLHDGIITPIKYKQYLPRLMHNAYHSVLGVSNNCNVDIK